MTETAIYPVPGLWLPLCPFCKRRAGKYHLLVYDREGVMEFEMMCENCKAAASQFAQMHQGGMSRQDILRDFGFRGRDAPWPNNS